VQWLGSWSLVASRWSSAVGRRLCEGALFCSNWRAC